MSSDPDDPEVAPNPAADLQSLNRSFYAADPAAYFRTRMLVLGLLIAKSDDLSDMLDGVTVEDLTLSVPHGPATAEDEAAHLAYLVTESESLVHHLAETLVRLFIAHRDLPPCPWLEVAELTQAWQFKQAAESIAADSRSDELLDQTIRVFIGEDTAPAREGAVNMRRTLVLAADRITKDAKTYNAVKHGLAVQAGQATFSITADGGGTFGAAGPALTHLELERDKTTGRVDYYMATRWTDIRSNLLLAQLLVAGIDALWTVARARYLGTPMTGVSLPSAEALDSLRDSPTRPPIRHLRVPVASRLPDAPADEPRSGSPNR